MKIAGFVLILVGMSGAAMAIPVGVPEVDGGTAASAICLVSGALLVLKSRFKK